MHVNRRGRAPELAGETGRIDGFHAWTDMWTGGAREHHYSRRGGFSSSCFRDREGGSQGTDGGSETLLRADVERDGVDMLRGVKESRVCSYRSRVLCSLFCTCFERAKNVGIDLGLSKKGGVDRSR
jgi:hypothetical protein